MDPTDATINVQGDCLPLDRSSSSSSPVSTSPSPSPQEQVDNALSGELSPRQPISKDLLDFAAGIPPAQLYALQLRQHNLLQTHLMLSQLAPTVPVLPSQQHLPYMPNYTVPAPVALNASQPSQASVSLASSSSISESLTELPEANRQAKRRRADRASWSADTESSEEDESEGMDRPGYKNKKAKLNTESTAETSLSDITNLLSLPQKEAAQRLGISESMLCKRFKECTRRKWPFRYLRKIEKTIASLESQKVIEPLSVEDQDRLEDLLKQRIECLAPVKIRITKSPSPVPSCARSAQQDIDSNIAMDEEDISDDVSDTDETDYESEAVEKLIDLSRCGSPRAFFAAPQIAF